MADLKDEKKSHENPVFTEGSSLSEKNSSTDANMEGTNATDEPTEEKKANGITPSEKNEPDNHIPVNVQRRVYTQAAFERGHGEARNRFHDKTLRKSVKRIGEKCQCSLQCTKKFFFSILPFLGIMSNYSLKEDLINDFISGLTVGIMQVPQGMAYALLANVPPVYGLYVSFIPPIVYFFFGTSRHINIGTFAVISLMVGNVVTGAGCESSGTDLTTTAPFTTEGVTEGWNSTGSTTPTNPGNSDEMACKVGVAVAVTFIGGLVQIFHRKGPPI